MSWGIDGIGVISPWGNSLRGFIGNFRKNKNSFISKNDFQEAGTMEIPHFNGHKLASSEKFEFKKIIPPLRLRKYDPYSRAGIAVSKMALEGVEKNDDKEIPMALVCSNETIAGLSSKFMKDIYLEGPKEASPRLFPSVSANSSSCQIAKELGIRGTSVNVGGLYSSSFLSLFSSCMILKANSSDDALSVSIDLFSPIILEAYSKLGVYKKRPQSKKGINPGEGSSAIRLKKGEGKFGKILNIAQRNETISPYKWPENSKTHHSLIKELIKGHKVDNYFSSKNGIEHLSKLEKETITGINELKGVKVFSPRDYLGESGSGTSFALISALSFPKGTKSVISVMGPGGIHGGILVESGGYFNE
jgi:hypothetical protein